MKSWQISKEDISTTSLILLLLIISIFTYIFLFRQPAEFHALPQSHTPFTTTPTPGNTLDKQHNTHQPPTQADILAAATAANCDLTPQEIHDPTRLILLRHNRELPIMSLSRDATDAAGAPPISEPYTVGWYNEGPKLGSHQGKAVLTSHTYHTGTALGNELNNGLWTTGDIIKVEDSAGHNACYTYRDTLHIMVEDYDPNSTIVYDTANAPMFAMVVCSDWDPHGNPLGRMIYYADLITTTHTDATGTTHPNSQSG
ncbi:class F sortase [Schaalia sp. Marseille-Q2122]|uniref:class F sortase n=1 Tax=Schaalia sp. Marseille-Q2122 TaxID=2736604 RepID=UPI00158E1E6B|nr:class F sortase [Schaalia sp. Marseille-Q2122]